MYITSSSWRRGEGGVGGRGGGTGGIGRGSGGGGGGGRESDEVSSSLSCKTWQYDICQMYW